MKRNTFIGLLSGLVGGLVGGLPAAAQVLRMGEASEGYEALFNGRDLGRWEGDETCWKVEDGLLRGSSDGAKEHVLLWEGKEFSGFELRFEMRVIRGAAAVRMQITGAAPLGVELRQKPEGLHLLAQGKVAAAIEAGSPGDWREYYVVAKEAKYRIVRNPLAVAVESTYSLSGVPAQGKLGLVLGAGAPVEAEFRRIRIKT
jgi:hypothetical protein